MWQPLSLEDRTLARGDNNVGGENRRSVPPLHGSHARKEKKNIFGACD